MLHSEMAFTRNGSVILFVLLITSAIISFACICWQCSTLYMQCMDERMRYEQEMSLLDGAVRYGVIYAQHHALAGNAARVLNLDAYAQLMRAEYHMVLCLSSALAGEIVVRAQLYYQAHPLRALSCIMTSLSDKKVMISGWHID